ncbi:uncharacterized protein LOC131393103 isoform X1 [Diceros bicornis minor]|uniref:uncharacterized protein LOC131393103 isoform X1 n=1 Tax=Diceros bicornis minor TaxID=77932 RepID=UPI0026EDC2DC|nr:uncharacterized protein LOC131393103 isoform X1 [Diceros bicornis minor]
MRLQLPTSQLIVFPSAGVLNPQELLTTHHPLCSAEHLHSLSEKDTRRSFQEVLPKVSKAVQQRQFTEQGAAHQGGAFQVCHPGDATPESPQEVAAGAGPGKEEAMRTPLD